MKLLNDFALSAKVLLAFAFAVLLSLVAHAAEAATWYVSSTNPSANRDGRSPETSWADLNEISWDQIQSGDRIQLDTGSGSGAKVVYRQPLVVRRSGVTIEVNPYKYGYASIEVGDTTNAAIDVDFVSGVSIESNRWQGLRTKGGVNGVHVGSRADTTFIRNITVEAAKVHGLYSQASLTCQQVVFKDSPCNVLADIGNNFSRNLTLYRCWIHNLNAPPQHPGVIMTNGSGLPATWDTSHPSFDSCIFGPGLPVGLHLAKPNTKVFVSNSLFINSQNANVSKSVSDTGSFNQGQTADVSPGVFYFDHCTSFMTPLNAKGVGHTCLSFGGKNDHVASSIFYGGIVQVPATAPRMTSNTQFRTSGNTLYLSPVQQDPKFTGNVALIPNAVSNAAICDPSGAYYNVANFALLPTSPIYSLRRGSSITSIRRLLSTQAY